MPITYLSYADLDADYEDIDCEDCGRKFFVDPKIQEKNPQRKCLTCRRAAAVWEAQLTDCQRSRDGHD